MTTENPTTCVVCGLHRVLCTYYDRHPFQPALATPAPAADEARCAFVGCGGVRDDVFHEPCLPGGAFHDHKACHPFQPAPTPAPPTPPATEPVAALVERDPMPYYDTLPQPKASRFELGAAVAADRAIDFNDQEPDRAQYDRRALLVTLTSLVAARAEVDVKRLARALHDGERDTDPTDRPYCHACLVYATDIAAAYREHPDDR